MKIKRIVLVSFLALSCVLALTLTAFASAEDTITKNQVTLSGYVAGVDWPLAMQDKIYYNATIYGVNVKDLLAPTATGGDANRVYVEPRSDVKTLLKVYLWADRTYVHENDGVSCGIGAKEVSLIMCNQGSTKKLTSDLI